MTESISKKKSLHSAEMRELIRRLYSFRNHFKAILPENLSALIEQTKSAGKTEIISNYNQYYYLGLILYRQKEPIAMGEISRLLDVPFSTATHMVDGFVKNGYAQRLADPDDRRIVRIALSDSGKQILETINEFILQRIGRIMDAFNDEEQEQMIHLLQKLVTVMEQEF
jgi:DNA-binding MarR family transcriptional regulator